MTGLGWPDAVGAALGVLVFLGLAWRYGAARVTAALALQPGVTLPRWLTCYGVAACAVIGMLTFGLAIRVAAYGMARPSPSKYVPMAGS